MTGQEYSIEMKRTFFRVVSFIESEKKGPKIPLSNTLERAQACLGISIRSISNLKREMRELTEEERQQLGAQNRKEDQKVHSFRRQTSGTFSSSSHDTSSIRTGASTIVPSGTTFASHRKQYRSASVAKSLVSVPEPRPAKKKGNVGPKPIILSELVEDTIRYMFHKMLAEKIYPTVATPLARLCTKHRDFLVRTKLTLLKTVKYLGFRYRKTSKSVNSSRVSCAQVYKKCWEVYFITFFFNISIPSRS